MAIGNIPSLLAFTFNMIALAYYYQMGKYFIKILIESQKDRIRFSFVVWILISLIIISNFQENFIIPVETLFEEWSVILLNE